MISLRIGPKIIKFPLATINIINRQTGILVLGVCRKIDFRGIPQTPKMAKMQTKLKDLNFLHPFSVHLLVFSFSARVDRSTTRKTPRETRGDTLQETTAPSIFPSKFLSKTPMNYAGLKNVHIWTRFVAFIYVMAELTEIATNPESDAKTLQKT